MTSSHSHEHRRQKTSLIKLQDATGEENFEIYFDYRIFFFAVSLGYGSRNIAILTISKFIMLILNKNKPALNITFVVKPFDLEMLCLSKFIF